VTLGGGATGQGATMSLTNGAGGTGISMNGGLTGNGSVVLPSEAISAAESLDEPGVASINTSNLFQLTGAVDQVLSHSLIAPTSGYVLAIATIEVQVNLHINGTTSRAIFGISDDLAFEPTARFEHQISSAAPTGGYFDVVTVQAIFPVSPGANTFRLLADKGSGTYWLENAQLSLVFLPTTYGAVFAPEPLSAQDGDSNELSDVDATPRDISHAAWSDASSSPQSVPSNRLSAGDRLNLLTAQITELQREIEGIKSKVK
jgi:hypothetical protein